MARHFWNLRGKRDTEALLASIVASSDDAIFSKTPDVVDDLVSSGCHNDGKRAGSFHLVGALLVLVSVDFAIVRIPDGKGTYADTRLQGQAVA